MRRYLFVALVAGVLSVLATTLLYESGLIVAAARKLATFYSNFGLIEAGTEPRRVVHYPIFIALAFSIAWCVVDIPRQSQKWIVVLGALVLTCGISVIAVLLGRFIEPFSGLTAIAISAAVGYAWSLTEHGRRKLVLHNVLGGRVSEAAFTDLLEGPPPDFLRGQNREVGVIILRVFNHTELCQTVKARDLIEMTNLFLENSGEFLTSRGGYLDESSPDCVRVYFGIIRRDAEPARTACAAAVELRQRLENLNEELDGRFFHRLEFGIAVGVDRMTLGIYRSENSIRLSAVGEGIDYLRRLCAANSWYGSRILVDSSVFRQLREDFAFRPMDMVQDEHTDLTLEIYELLDEAERMTEEDEEAGRRFWEGVILYRENRGEEALAIFSELVSRDPEDRPLQLFIQRAQQETIAESETEEDEPAEPVRHTRLLHHL